MATYQHLFAQLQSHTDAAETLVVVDNQGNNWEFYRSHAHSDYVVKKNQDMLVAVDDLTVALLALHIGTWHP